MTTKQALRSALMAAMGRAGILSFQEVARMARLDARTVRGLDWGTSIGTLIVIADVLRCSVSDLVSVIDSFREG